MAKTKQSANNKDSKVLLKVQTRTVFGKKLNKLRKEDKVPANIYGPGFKSTAVSIDYKDFIKTYKIARETSVVYLDLDNKEIPVLIKNVQKHPVNDILLHVDLRKIDLSQKVETEVPIKIMGQSPAVAQKGGVLLTLSKTLLVEALPTDIPQYIEIDISTLSELGQEIKVSQLKKSTSYEIKTPLDKVVVSVVEHKEESVTPETTPVVAPEVITAKPEEEAAEGAPVEAGGKAPAKAPEAKPASGKAAENKPAQSSKSAKPAEGKK